MSKHIVEINVDGVPIGTPTEVLEIVFKRGEKIARAVVVIDRSTSADMLIATMKHPTSACSTMRCLDPSYKEEP